MNLRSLLSLFYLLALVMAVGVYLLVDPRPTSPREQRSAGQEGVETENPGERLEWEWMRLRDPKTGVIPADIHRRELAFAARLPRREAILAKSSAETELAAAEWEARGPYNVGGRTRALAVDVAHPSTIVAGGASGGMWRSTDGGGSWSRTTKPEQLPAVSCVAQDTRPGRTDTWYYGTGEYYGSTASVDQSKYSGDGIYKSTDGGASWHLLPSTLTGSPALLDNQFEYVWNIAIDPSNTVQDELYAAVYGGIKRSTDGGATWSDVLGGMNIGGVFTDVAVTNDGVVYATMSSINQKRGIWRSDNGVNWTEITPGGWPATYNRIVIGVAPSNPNVVFFLGETPNAGFRVSSQSGTEWHSLWRYTYQSGNGSGDGGIWEDRSNNLPPSTGTFGGFRSQRSYDMVIKVKPDDEDVVFIGGTNLYRSTNGFATGSATRWIGGYKSSFLWLDFSYPNHHPDQHSLAFDPNNPSILYSGHDGGVTRTMNAMTTDSVVWESLNHGYFTTQLYALAIDHGTPGDNTIIAGMQDNSSWMTRSGGATDPWKQVGPGDGAFCAVADGGNAYYVSSQGGRIYRVGVGSGGDVEGFTRIDPSGGPAYLFVNPFALDPSDNRILYHLSGSAVWRNTNPTAFPLDSSSTAKTVNWTRVNPSGSGPGVFSAIGVSTRSPEHRVWVGTTSGEIAVLDDADKFLVTPRVVTGGLSSGYISCVAVDPENGDRAIVVFSNYRVQSLFLTEDGGQSWKHIGGNLEERPDGSGDGPSCRWASILHRGGSIIYYVGTSTGLYSTTELRGDATVWVQEGASTIGNVVVDMIDVRQSDGFVAVGTHGNGVYTATLGTIGVPKEESSDAVVRLDGSVPNPVIGSATIGFTLGRPASVRLSLYDITGREVRRLLDGDRIPAGSHTIPFDAADPGAGALPGGLYYYRIEAMGVRRAGSVVVIGR